MKLSNETLQLLKNFSTINSNIYIPAGNVVKSMSVVGNILAQATIKETFDKSIGVYDLGEFLSVLSIAPDSELILKDNYMEISWNRSKIKYLYADDTIMKDAINASSKNVKLPETEINFTMTADMLNSINKASSILKTYYLSVFSDNGKVSIKTFDKTNPNSNDFKIETDVETSYNFDMVVGIDNLKLMSGDYDVSISSRNISRWQNQNTDTVYYITLDTTSTFS